MTKSKKIILTIFILISFVLFVLILGYVSFKRIYRTDFYDIIKLELNQIENKDENINISLILSVIKTESGFDEKAKSNKDAYGLMQLTFLTAKDEAVRQGIDISLNDLFIPKTNIKLGTNYLNYLYKNLGKTEYVLMAYNAGINRVKSWINNNEIKINNGEYECPFLETTNYVKKVLTSQKIYKKLIKE